ncbi:MAG: DUF58 domain-containing protein [Acidobacteria bacterium]|nr:DUF58 domain-containing protein [Acidobacteriota bacterium]
MNATRFLDPRVLSKTANLTLVAKTVVQGFLAGLHRSPYMGFSVDFVEYRPYTEGDDLRHVDWNVYARSDRYYMKKFEGETNTEILLILDVSGSMQYSSGAISKLEYGKFLVASLAHLACRQKDAVGLALFGENLKDYIRPRVRPGHLGRILHALEAAEPSRQTAFREPLEKVAQLQRRRGIIVLVSDFYEALHPLADAIRRLRFTGSDLILFHVLDPQELRFQLPRPTLLEDMETGELLEVDPLFAKNEYPALIEEHVGSLRRECVEARIDYEVMDTARPLDHALFRYLSARQQRR